ncbi:hypothetical protein [Paraburkholderia sp. MM6662-R1]|uniref:hypothetical protein n=1 Tax=Paraburkholderia sp. MM6662-R1 TaxID=2991066 RepID=UPI003D1CE266
MLTDAVQISIRAFMGFIFTPYSTDIAHLSTAPKQSLDGMWGFGLPKYRYGVELVYDPKSSFIPPPKRLERWRIGIVQNVLFEAIRIGYQGRRFLNRFTNPAVDCATDSSKPFYAPPLTRDYAISQTGPNDQNLILREYRIASYDIEYSPEGMVADAASNPSLAGGDDNISLLDSNGKPLRAPKTSKLTNPRLTFFMGDQPYVCLSWRDPNFGQLVSIQRVMLMKFWLLALAPNKDIVICSSEFFTLAGWFELSGLSDSKGQDFRVPSFDNVFLDGNQTSKVTANIKSARSIAESQKPSSLDLTPGPKSKTKPVMNGKIANDSRSEWVSAQGFTKIGTCPEPP